MNKLNFFLLPTLMLSLLSVFIMTVIDSYSGFIEVLIEESNLDTALNTLFKAGEPIHLGFCLHVFLHFFIIHNNMKNFKKNKEVHNYIQKGRTSKRANTGRLPQPMPVGGNVTILTDDEIGCSTLNQKLIEL